MTDCMGVRITENTNEQTDAESNDQFTRNVSRGFASRRDYSDDEISTVFHLQFPCVVMVSCLQPTL